MKRGQRGFTLVELLVVMAIIAILAAIVVPNVVRYIGRSRATKALGDITSIELALTKMVADADRSNLNHLFNPGNPNLDWNDANQSGVRQVLHLSPGQLMTIDQFKNAMKLYSRTIYALLREGRSVLADSDTEFGIPYRQILNESVVKKLGTSYLEDIGLDPWGNMYQIWPGPWVRSAGGANLIPFRTFASDTSSLPGTRAGAQPDAWTCRVVDPATDIEEIVGYSAPRDKIAFIFSYGANMVSSQAIYGSPIDAPNGQGIAANIYDVSQGEEFAGGGDDINNWDKGQSYMRFYN